MATSNVGLLYPAATIHELSVKTDEAHTDVPLQLLIMAAVGVAAAAGLYTATADLETYDSLQAQSLINALNGLGYGVSYSGHTLTLTW